MRRTKEDAAETARQLLQVAHVLFLEKGYDNVNLDDIAAQVGVTRGAVNWHFRNKQGILLALREQALVPFKSLVEEIAIFPGVASLERLCDVIARTFQQFQDDPRERCLVRCMIRLDLMLAEEMRLAEGGFREQMFDAIAEVFHAVERDVGLPSPWNAQKAAAALHAVTDGLFVNWALGSQSFTLSPDGENFIRELFTIWKN